MTEEISQEMSVTTAQAQQLIRDEKRKRQEACARAIQQALNAHSCRISVWTEIRDGTVRHNIDIIPLDE